MSVKAFKHVLPRGSCVMRGSALHSRSNPDPLPEEGPFFLCKSQAEAERYAKSRPRRVYRYSATRDLTLFDMRCVGGDGLGDRHDSQAEVRRFFTSRAATEGERCKLDEYFDFLSRLEAPDISADRVVLDVLERQPSPHWDGVLRRSHSEWQGGVVEEFLMLTRTLRPHAAAEAGAAAANADPRRNAAAHAESGPPLAYVGCRDLGVDGEENEKESGGGESGGEK